MAVVVVFIGVAIGLLGLGIKEFPAPLRAAIALVIATVLVTISFQRPRAAILLTLALLPLLALIRRLLTPLAAWTSWDLLLLIAPLVALMLVHRGVMMERRPIAKDFFSKMVLALLGLIVTESLNPASGSVTAGITGLLFVAAPLLWFFVGREFTDRKLVNAVLAATLVMGLVAGAYGLWQITMGFPSWDDVWIKINFDYGYVSLSVAGLTRAFGTLSNSAEYAMFLGVAFVIAFVAVLHGRWLAVLAVPILGYALLLSSERGIVVFALLAIAIAVGARTGKLSMTILSTLCAAVLAIAVINVYGARLTDMADSTGNPFVIHQVEGLMHPFDPDQSTYSMHQQLLFDGITTSLAHPLGLGVAAINPHAGRLAATANGTEVDVSNIFVSLGPAGGAIFVVIILVTFYRIARLALSRGGDITSRVVWAVLVVTLGQWLNGSFYAVAPLIWLLIGWVTVTTLRRDVSAAASSIGRDANKDDYSIVGGLERSAAC